MTDPSGRASELQRERDWATELQDTLDALMNGVELWGAENLRHSDDARRELRDLVDQANESRVDALRRYEGWERKFMPSDPRGESSR